jgi:NCS1 family nucleobase:cation symporter-1
VFQVTWFVGFLGGGLVYYLICLVFPPAGAPYEKVYGMYGNAEIDTEEVLVGEGQSDIEKGSSVEENTGHVKIKVDGKADL